MYIIPFHRILDFPLSYCLLSFSLGLTWIICTVSFEEEKWIWSSHNSFHWFEEKEWIFYSILDFIWLGCMVENQQELHCVILPSSSRHCSSWLINTKASFPKSLQSDSWQHWFVLLFVSLWLTTLAKGKLALLTILPALNRTALIAARNALCGFLPLLPIPLLSPCLCWPPFAFPSFFFLPDPLSSPGGVGLDFFLIGFGQCVCVVHWQWFNICL